MIDSGLGSTVVPTRLGLQRDPALPWRDVLLDASIAGDLLRNFGSAGDAEVEACALLRVNYQVGKSLRAVFRIRMDGQERTVAVRMFRRGKSAEAFARAASHARPCGTLRGIVHLARFDSVAWLFPNDRKIETLPTVLHSDAPATADIPATAGRYRLAAYAPEKSATLAYVDDADQPLAYVKVAAANQAERDGQTYQDLRAGLAEDNPWLKLPRPMAYSAAVRALWLEAIDGRRLAEASGVEPPDDLRRLGRAVAAFHGLRAPHAPSFTRFSDERLAGDAALIGRVRSDVGAAVTALAHRLARTAPAPSSGRACLHGDLHPKNAIDCGDRLALIDVEDVALGPAAADLGSLIASLLYLEVSRQLSHSQVAAQVAAFLEGYADVRRLPPAASITWHTAAALYIERASRAVTRIRPLGLGSLPALVAEAERVLDRRSDWR